MTIADRIAVTNGRSSGFDYMRLILAASVIIWHGCRISYTGEVELKFQFSPLGTPIRFILPMFFALSGFLVAGSLERCRTLIKFLGLRTIRIYPALAVEILLSALIVGPTFTTRPLGDYFSDPMFYGYFWNITGENIHFTLPGVFEHNPNPAMVNFQLWTVPAELACYIVLSALSLLGLRRWRIIAPLAIAIATVWLYVHESMRTNPRPGEVTSTTLVVCFLAGVAIYLYRDRLPYSRVGAALATLCATALLYVPLGIYLVPVPIAYLTVCLGLLNPKRLSVIKGADYSYGMYLYGFVIQQALAATGPWARHWYTNDGAALVIAAAFSALSWCCVEKPATKLKNHLDTAEHWWLDLVSPKPAPWREAA